MPNLGSGKDRIERELRFCAAGAGIATAAIGGMHLFAWLAGMSTHTGLTIINMKANAALCLVLCGIALFLVTVRSSDKLCRIVSQTLAALAMTIGVLTLSEHILRVDLGIDQLLAQEAPGALGTISPNRMGPPGSISFALGGAAILLLHRRSDFALRLAQFLAILVCWVALLAFLGHLYGATALYGAARLTAIAWPTTIAVVLLANGVLFARPREGVMAQVISRDPGGAALRRLIPAVTLIPIVLGWLRLQGEWRALYVTNFGTSILVASVILVFSILIYHTAKRLSASAAELQRVQTLLLEAERLSNTGAWEWDLSTDRWTFADEWLRIHGIRKRILTRDELLALAHPEDRAAISEALADLARGVTPYDLEHRIIRVDTGEVRIIRARGQFVKDRAGRVVRVFGFARDITESKHAEEELRKAKAELEVRVAERSRELERTYRDLNHESEERIIALEHLRESERLLIQQSRLAAMGEMLTNIAHQWRQPLNSLALLVQELGLYYDAGRFTREYLAEVEAKAMQVINHMSQTIDDFRSFLQPEKERECFSANEAVAKTVSLFEATLRAMEVELEVRQSEEIVVEGHRNQFSQTILNLITNARDAFREREIKSPRLVISLFREGKKCIVTIADNAGGIPEAIMGKIFDPYFTTKGPDKGTGIGLFMSRNIVEKNLHGTLTVRNIEGGAEFRIEMPCQ